MANLRETANLLQVPMAELRSLLTDSERFPVRRGRAGRGNRRIPHATLRGLLAHYKKRFRPNIATIGIEKGGVGKSFLTVNAAVSLSRKGCRCLLIDLDPQACATNLLLPDDTDYAMLPTTLEVYGSQEMRFRDAVSRTKCEGLDLVASKGKARRLHRALANADPKTILRERMEGLDGYDLILFDVPPTFGDIITSAYLTSRLVVMPTLPDIWSIESIDLTLADIRDACEEFGCEPPACRVLLNRCATHRSATRDAAQELKENYADLLLPFEIRETAAIQNAINEGDTVFQSANHRIPADIRDALDRLGEIICPLEGDSQTPTETIREGA